MSDFTVCALHEVPDAFGGKYPGSMRFMAEPLGTEQVAITHRLMPPQSGGKGGYGHRHLTQEEVYVVTSGTLQFKLGDEVIDVAAPAAVRVAPATVRSVFNDSDADAEVIIVSTRLAEDAPEDGVIVEGFWPA